jgi:hypothetical protein
MTAPLSPSDLAQFRRRIGDLDTEGAALLAELAEEAIIDGYHEGHHDGATGLPNRCA